MNEVYRLPLYYSLIVIALAGFFFVMAFVKKEKILGVIGLVLLLLFLPMTLGDKLVVTDERITQRTGIWFAPAKLEFEYDRIESFSVNETYYTDGSESIWWNIAFADGTREELNPSELWKDHTKHLLEVIRKHGFEKTDKADPDPKVAMGHHRSERFVRIRNAGADRPNTSTGSAR